MNAEELVEDLESCDYFHKAKRLTDTLVVGVEKREHVDTVKSFSSTDWKLLLHVPIETGGVFLYIRDGDEE